jgi:hypothetical protein
MKHAAIAVLTCVLGACAGTEDPEPGSPVEVEAPQPELKPTWCSSGGCSFDDCKWVVTGCKCTSSGYCCGQQLWCGGQYAGSSSYACYGGC